VLVRKLRSLPNVAIHTNAQTTEITGDGQKVTGLRYRRSGDRGRSGDRTGRVFVQIGLVPNTEWLKGTVELSKYGRSSSTPKGPRACPACSPQETRRRHRSSRSSLRRVTGRSRAISLRPLDSP